MKSSHMPSTEQSDVNITFSDKIIGVITEPFQFYERLAIIKPRYINWLAPILILIAMSSVTNYLMMSNPVIVNQAVERQMAAVEASLNNAVTSGQLTRDAADAQLDKIRESVEAQIGSGVLINLAAIFVMTFVLFFITTGVYFLITKFVLKGDGNYSTMLSAYGSTYYILILQIIVMLIYALATDNLISSTSLAYFTGMDSKEFGGYLMSKVDPFSVWFHLIVGIAIAKMFKSANTVKYILSVFGLWIGFSLLFFWAARQFPILQMFIQ